MSDLNARAALHLRRGFAQFLRELEECGQELPLGADVGLMQRGGELEVEVTLVWRSPTPAAEDAPVPATPPTASRARR